MRSQRMQKERSRTLNESLIFRIKIFSFLDFMGFWGFGVLGFWGVFRGRE
jgi:hypothetical protein